MKFVPWYLALLLLVFLLLTQTSIGPQLAVLGLTLGIFFGTLSLRRPSPGDATSTNH